MVSVQKIRNDFARLEKKRDSLLECRNFKELKTVLDEIDRLKVELAQHDPDSIYAQRLKIERFKKIYNNKRG
jgi:hypothetical protein